MQKKLYAVRIGFNKFLIATYIQIKNDMYKELKEIKTDNDIVVRINKDEDGNYRITELISDEAKLKSYDHNFLTPLYKTTTEAIINYCKKRIQESQREINKNEKKLKELRAKLKEIDPNNLKIKKSKLKSFNFGDIVYLASTDNPNLDTLSFKVDKKVFIKDGSLIEIQSENYQKNYCGECSRSIIDGFCVDKDMLYTDENGHKYKAFKDFTSAENSLKKLKITLIKREIKECKDYIEFYTNNIEVYNKAIKSNENLQKSYDSLQQKNQEKE